ncbi:sensor histidine kinase [Lysobacter sp. GCM10012299]|uniref:sensor histidine kinase n=1 Tax=Lysobacter sp. GCM10012299 TaxID=3317333 RepID=UPI00360F7D1E
MSAPRSGLRRRILLGLLGYVVVLTVAVILHGFLVNEHAEQLVWQGLLDAELDHIRELSSKDPDYRWVDTSNIALYDGRNPADIPPALRSLEPGVHDEVVVDGVERVVLVREVEGRPIMLALDITALEQREFDMGLTVVGSAVTMIVLLGIAIAWSVNRLVRPLSEVAKDIAHLQPDHSGQRIEVPESATSELVVIADALNDYLQRNDRFVERERTFIDSASHELRTPIAVIAGASEIALQQPDVPAGTRGQLNRIQRTARDVEQLISLLLVLAKDPARLAGVSDRVALDQLLPEIVDDHRHLTRDKDLVLSVSSLLPCEILAPLPIVQAAIGNLLRNAIEHSDRGEITIRLEAPATVVIDDPGHGMTPEEISAIYAKVARGGGERHGGGIGLDLISRLCEHLGWKLDIASDAGHGTTTTLRFVA